MVLAKHLLRRGQSLECWLRLLLLLLLLHDLLRMRRNVRPWLRCWSWLLWLGLLLLGLLEWLLLLLKLLWLEWLVELLGKVLWLLLRLHVWQKLQRRAEHWQLTELL